MQAVAAADWTLTTKESQDQDQLALFESVIPAD